MSHWPLVSIAIVCIRASPSVYNNPDDRSFSWAGLHGRRTFKESSVSKRTATRLETNSERRKERERDKERKILGSLSLSFSKPTQKGRKIQRQKEREIGNSLHCPVALQPYDGAFFHLVFRRMRRGET